MKCGESISKNKRLNTLRIEDRESRIENRESKLRVALFNVHVCNFNAFSLNNLNKF